MEIQLRCAGTMVCTEGSRGCQAVVVIPFLHILANGYGVAPPETRRVWRPIPLG